MMSRKDYQGIAAALASYERRITPGTLHGRGVFKDLVNDVMLVMSEDLMNTVLFPRCLTTRKSITT